MPDVHIGTSGWSYDEWIGVFYPDKDTPKLKYYSSIFDTVEVDSSFYSFPKPSTVFGWVKNSGSNFTFSLKLPKIITHDMMLGEGSSEQLDRFLNVIQPLWSSEKLGVLLVQLPPRLSFNDKLLEGFLASLPSDQYKFAVEFRNTSWLREETWKILRQYGVANTIVDEPILPSDILLTAKYTYIRWHGHGKKVWYDYKYGANDVKSWAGKIRQISKSHQVYGYWNNHFHGYAILNSLQELRELGMMNERRTHALADAERSFNSRKTLTDYI
ncbi:MAG: DUF72 domain-containing protein [Conexivisphaerales archaeon]